MFSFNFNKKSSITNTGIVHKIVPLAGGYVGGYVGKKIGTVIVGKDWEYTSEMIGQGVGYGVTAYAIDPTGTVETIKYTATVVKDTALYAKNAITYTATTVKDIALYTRGACLAMPWVCGCIAVGVVTSYGAYKLYQHMNQPSHLDPVITLRNAWDKEDSECVAHNAQYSKIKECKDNNAKKFEEIINIATQYKIDLCNAEFAHQQKLATKQDHDLQRDYVQCVTKANSMDDIQIQYSQD